MFHRKDSKNPSEIELTTTKKNSQGHFQASIKIENYRTLVQSLMTTSNILPLTQIQDLLNPIMVAQDEIIKNAMKANLA
ncbi:MAG TPA: hypothetical protein VHM20_05620, partial [Gammaproteobacteria bacterium]|nr:hypothetical protein [Gammaproteobacteria bacterium]